MSILFLESNNTGNSSNDLCNESDFVSFYDEFTKTNISFLNDFVRSNQNKVITNEDGTIFGFMLGTIYDLQKKKDLLEKRGHIFKTDYDIEYIIHLYEDFGEQALTNLNGKFIIILIDKLKQECIITNDRYGFYTMYMYNKNKHIILSNIIDPILKALDDYSFSETSRNEFFNFGYLLNDNTMFNDIHKLEPATIIKIKSNGMLQKRKYWDWNEIKKGTTDSYQDAVVKLGELWLKSLDKTLNKYEKVNITLSGGLDSRAILAGIAYLNKLEKVECTYTFGIKGSLDHLIAEQVAKVANTKHKFIEYGGEYWWGKRNVAAQNYVGAVNIIHSHGLAMLQEDIFDKVFLNGFIGDLVLGGSFLNKKLFKLNNQDKKIYIEKSLRTGEGIRKTEVLKNFQTVKVNDKLDNQESTDYFFIKNSRVRNFTLMGTELLGHNYNDDFPFLENELIDYVYTLPDEWRLNSKIYIDMLLLYFPDYFKEIPWQKTGYPISYSQFNISLRSLPKKVNKKLFQYGNKLGLVPSFKDNFNFVDYDNWMRIPGVRQGIYNLLLSKECLNRGIFDNEEVKNLLEKHMNQRENCRFDIGMIVTYELFARIYSKED